MDAAAQLLSVGNAGLALGSLLAQAVPAIGPATALAGPAPLLHPAFILTICAAAGIGTALLLPGGKSRSVRTIGGIIALLAGLVFFGWLAKGAHQTWFGPAGLYFYAFALIAVVSAVRVITHTRPVYSALYFVLTVFATAGLFVLLHADFMAAALVIIYAGAILVTYVFVIMLASEATPNASGTGAFAVGDAPLGIDQTSRDPWVASALGFALMAVLLYAVFDQAEQLTLRSESASYVVAPDGDVDDAPVVVHPAPPSIESVHAGDSVQALGTYLFDRQVLNLLLAGLLLTVAMIGAIMIARRKVVSEGLTFDDDGMPREVIHTPATPTDDNPHSIPVYGTDNPRAKEYPQL